MPSPVPAGPPGREPLRILYVTTNFSSLTLTFVAREVSQLRALGEGIELLSLRPEPVQAAREPECDTSGQLFAHPVRALRVLLAVAGLACRRPRRLGRAIRLALASPGDSPAVRLKLLYQLGVAATLVKRVEALRVDHIHAHLASPPGSYALFLSLLTGIPFSFTAHAADLYRKPEALPAKLRLAAGVVAISRYNLEFYRRQHPGLARAAIVHCGVDPEAFPFRQRGAPGRPLRILAVGRAAPKKGFAYLLEALHLLDRRDLPWRADLAGDGPLLEDLRRRARELRLDALQIHGALQMPRIKELLAAADVFVLPCVRAPDGDVDGIPVALMEAMASGCPVVSTRVSGIPELVVHERTGLLAEPEDAAGLADALARLAGSPDLVAELSRGGRQQVEREFNLHREARKLRDFFHSLRDGADAGAGSGPRV